MDERPSIILRTKPSSIMLDAHDMHLQPSTSADCTTIIHNKQSGEELGTVARATRIPRAVSRRSSFSSEIMLRPSSRSSTVSSLISAFSPTTTGGGDGSNSSSSRGGARDRSSTMGSITSEGFRNMIASNRNSWALSEFGNESGVLSPTTATAAEGTTPREASLPLSVRSVNRLESNRLSANDLEKEKKQEKPRLGDQRPVTPTITYTPPARGSKTSITTVGNDENVPPSPTPRRQRIAEPTHQRSVPSLRYKPSTIMSMR